jgi:predicted ATPase with chaperone activity
VTKYQKHISDPILGRIDIHIEVPRVDYEKLSGDRLGETSESIRRRVQAARDIQNQPFSGNGSRQFCQLQDEGQSLMRAAMSQLNLSARAYHRILKLARTIDYTQAIGIIICICTHAVIEQVENYRKANRVSHHATPTPAHLRDDAPKCGDVYLGSAEVVRT